MHFLVHSLLNSNNVRMHLIHAYEFSLQHQQQQQQGREKRLSNNDTHNNQCEHFEWEKNYIFLHLNFQCELYDFTEFPSVRSFFFSRCICIGQKLIVWFSHSFHSIQTFRPIKQQNAVLGISMCRLNSIQNH